MKVLNHFIHTSEIEYKDSRYRVSHNAMDGLKPCRIAAVQQITRINANVSHVSSLNIKYMFSSLELQEMRALITAHSTFTNKDINERKAKELAA